MQCWVKYSKCLGDVFFVCTGMLVFMAFASLSVFTLVVDKGWLNESVIKQINFIPMVSVILAYVGVGLGFLVIPVLIAAETIPVEVRSTAFGVFMTLEMLSTFFISKLKPLLMEKLQLYGLFALFSGKRETGREKYIFLILYLRYCSDCYIVDDGVQAKKGPRKS